jgi:spore coat protein H
VARDVISTIFIMSLAHWIAKKNPWLRVVSGNMPPEKRSNRPRFQSSRRTWIAGACAAAGVFALVSDGKAQSPNAVPLPPLTSATSATILNQRDAAKTTKNHKEIDEFLNNPNFPTLVFEFEPEEWENLKKDNRRYAECTMIEVGGALRNEHVAVKLKGSAGSFQGQDGKPGLTLNFDKYKGSDRYHGQKKMHLNNCAQDGTYLMEKISGEIARKCGVPASRCSHAFIKWQGRDLGLYVVKEAFTKDFLAKFFSDVDGDLYDGGFVREIDENCEKDLGDWRDKANLKQLLAACREQDAQKRWAAIDQIVNVEAYITFTALESILSHWDGYNFNRNNYRFYHEPKSTKFVFFLHGMDQTFGDPNAPAVRDSGSMVGQAIFSNPAWRAKYRERVELIYEQVLKPIDWPARVVEIGNEVKAALEKKNPQWAKDFGGRIQEARSRVEQRIASIGKQLGDMPKPLAFSPQGIAKIDAKGWRTEGSASKIEEANSEGKPVLRIHAEGDTTASWRKNLHLTPGKYRFEGRVRTAGVQASESSSGNGAGLRISGGTRTGQNSIAGDSAWQTVGFQFDTPGGDVILVAELRATKGEAMFDKDSFQLIRVQ